LGKKGRGLITGGTRGGWENFWKTRRKDQPYLIRVFWDELGWGKDVKTVKKKKKYGGGVINQKTVDVDREGGKES